MAQVTYVVIAERKDLDRLEKDIDSLEIKRYRPLLELYGEDVTTYDCRGEFLDVQDDNDVLRIHMETAWCENQKFRRFLERIYRAKVYYICTEYGMEIFTTNDDTGNYFPIKYEIEYNDQFENVEDDEELVLVMSGLLNESFDNAEHVKQYIKEHNLKVDDAGSEDYIFLHEYQYVND